MGWTRAGGKSRSSSLQVCEYGVSESAWYMSAVMTAAQDPAGQRRPGSKRTKEKRGRAAREDERQAESSDKKQETLFLTGRRE